MIDVDVPLQTHDNRSLLPREFLVRAGTDALR